MMKKASVNKMNAIKKEQRQEARRSTTREKEKIAIEREEKGFDKERRSKKEVAESEKGHEKEKAQETEKKEKNNRE